MVVWTDASLRIGLGFVYAGNGFAYQLNPPPVGTIIDIFFLELVAILSALHHVASFPNPPRRLLVWTDSLDSVAVFNSLGAAEPIHNSVLLAIAGIVLRTGIEIRLRHIEGKKNVRADLLSRLLIDEYSEKFPSDKIRLFTPPRDLLPAPWKQSF
ncbi:hypothetical protein C8R43DRAFT_887575 [Mycena crocata]|nr:hypothetical protein C8R43DRAFT_887575 [Mycena crocata]